MSAQQFVRALFRSRRDSWRRGDQEAMAEIDDDLKLAIGHLRDAEALVAEHAEGGS